MLRRPLTSGVLSTSMARLNGVVIPYGYHANTPAGTDQARECPRGVLRPVIASAGRGQQAATRRFTVEGANGVGRPLAQRLLESGGASWTSRPRLAARLRLFDAGHNRKTDAHDAHSIAMVAVRTAGLRVLQARW